MTTGDARPPSTQQNQQQQQQQQQQQDAGASSKRGKTKLQPGAQIRANLYRSSPNPGVPGRQYANRADAIRANAKEGMLCVLIVC